MKSVSHREMRNRSGELLRRVEAGESVLVTNNGRVAAIIGPATGSALDALVRQGNARAAVRDVESLRTIARTTSDLSGAQIIADARGPW